VDGTITIVADTLDEARSQARSELPPGHRVASEILVCDGRPQTIEAEGSTAEEAFAKLDAVVPNGATVTERRIVRQPGRRTLVVEAFDEQGAGARIRENLRSYEEIDAIRLAAAGSKGVFGIGKKPNRYEGSLVILARSALAFTQKANIEVSYRPMSLREAIEADDVPTVENLLAAHANVEEREEGGTTLLMLAAKQGSVATVRVLLAAGAEVNAATSWGATALAYAAQGGAPTVVEALMNKGADPNCREYDGYTPLIRAAMNGHAQAVEMLLSAGAERSATQKHGRTALSFAKERGHVEVVRLLLRDEIPPKVTGDLPVSAIAPEAARGGSAPDMFSLSIQNGTIPPIPRDILKIELVGSRSLGDAGAGAASFQQAIRSWNEQDFAAAERHYRHALQTGLAPLHEGYAHANLGAILLKRDDLVGAIEQFLQVFSARSALYETVHEPAEYMSVILSEAGRADEAALFRQLADQTGARLGTRLSAEAAAHAQALTRAAQIK